MRWLMLFLLALAFGCGPKLSEDQRRALDALGKMQRNGELWSRGLKIDKQFEARLDSELKDDPVTRHQVYWRVFGEFNRRWAEEPKAAVDWYSTESVAPVPDLVARWKKPPG